MPEAAYYVFLKITFGLPKKLVGTCNFRVTSSHANCERRKADVRGFLQNPDCLPSGWALICAPTGVVCADSRSRHRGWRLPSSVWAAWAAQASGKGRRKRRPSCRLKTWEVISAMPWRMGNWVSVVFWKRAGWAVRKERIASGAGGRLQNNPSFYVFSRSWSNGCKRSVCCCPCSPCQLLKIAFAHPDYVWLNILGVYFVISFLKVLSGCMFDMALLS